jgi:hypothetical protein
MGTNSDRSRFLLAGLHRLAEQYTIALDLIG